MGGTTVTVDSATGELVERATYTAYGQVESDYRPSRWGDFREDYKFTGKEEDSEFGLTYFGARYYAPNLGRWISPDPATIHGLASDPNPYAYVHGRVLTSVDPDGRCGQPSSSGGGGGSSGGGGQGAGGSDGSGSTGSSSGGGSSGGSSSGGSSSGSDGSGDGSGDLGVQCEPVMPAGASPSGAPTKTAGAASPAPNSASVSAYPNVTTQAPYALAGAAAVGIGPWEAAGAASGALLADDATGAGVGDDFVIPVIIAGAAVYDLAERTYITYTLTNPTGQVYVGRASGFGSPQDILAGRLSSHHMIPLGFGAPMIDVAVQGAQGYPAIRGREQQLIDAHGGVGSPAVANVVRGVSAWNPFGFIYWAASNAWFGALAPYTGVP